MSEPVRPSDHGAARRQAGTSGRTDHPREGSRSRTASARARAGAAGRPDVLAPPPRDESESDVADGSRSAVGDSRMGRDEVDVAGGSGRPARDSRVGRDESDTSTDERAAMVADASASVVDAAPANGPVQGSGSAAPLPDILVPAARHLFGDRLDLAARYAELLATDGVVRGLVGPREAPRMWDRHLLNCAAMAELVPVGASVVDIGSGAGLPGLVLAVARPDLRVTLVEPMARRTAFLDEAVEDLGLSDAVSVVRARAEECARSGMVAPADVVTARAVASLDRLAAWSLPLAKVGGRLLALKGASAEEEVVAFGDAVRRLGGGQPRVRMCGAGRIDPPATVVEVVRERMVDPSGKQSSRRSGRARR